MQLLRGVLHGPLAGRIACVSSFGAESAVLLDMVASIDRRMPVIFLDTGKLFAETLDYQRSLCAELGLRDVRIVRPEPGDLRAARPATAGCTPASPTCAATSARPSRWSVRSRASTPGSPAASASRAARGWPCRRSRATPPTGRIKLNPLAGWSAEDIRHYRRLRQLPPHPLALKGFASIGCAPCTRPVRHGEDPRAGRWWGLDKTECGIHRPGV